MNLHLPHLIFLCGMTLYIIIRLTFQKRAASQDKPINKSSLSDRFLIALVGIGQIVLPILFLFTPWLNWANYDSSHLFSGIGALTMGGGLWLFLRSHTDLGKNWSVTLEIGHNHQLITQGVYRYIRHPMYASFFLMGFSQLFLLNNWIAGWSALFAVTLLYFIRIPHEEKMMMDFFGQDYHAYMSRTGGIIPRF